MRRFWLTALAVSLTAALGAPARAENVLDKVKQKGVLLAGVTEDAPPFSFLDRATNQVVGYDVDYLAAVAQKLGVKLELQVVTESDRLSELLEGRVDLLAANLTHGPGAGRERVVDFTEAYVSTGQKFLARTGTVQALTDLWGKKVGAVIGTPSEGCARDRCSGGTIIPFDDYVQGVQALQRGAIDAFTTDELILLDLLGSLPRGDYEIPDVQISQEEYFLGVRKGEKALLEAVNKAIRELKESGEARELRDAWFKPPERRPPTAYGALLRKASTRQRFLGVVLNGVLVPGGEVDLYALDGSYLGVGFVARVLQDEFYLDVDRALADVVRPGFLVTMNMTAEMARDVLIRQGELLKTVRAEADQEAERLLAEMEREGIEKQKRAQEVDLMREESRLTIQEERAMYNQTYRPYYRGPYPRR